jgi:hypothetical protein
MNTKPHQPWHHVWQGHRHAVRSLADWSGLMLTLLLLGLGAIIVWIALRGSNRTKAAAAVWTLFP